MPAYTDYYVIERNEIPMKVSRESAQKSVEYLKQHHYFGELSPTNVMHNLPQTVVAFDYDACTMSTEYEVRDWMLNPANTMHGGFIAMCADTALGQLVETLVGHYTPTVELSVSYLRAVPPTGSIVISGHAGHVGRTLAHVTGEIYSKETGKLLATCKGVYFTAAVEKG